MKLATYTLVVLSVAAGAAEPDKPAPAKTGAAAEWKLDYDLKLDKKIDNITGGMTIIGAPTKCYFIRMVRPLPEASPPDAVPQSPRLIPLQAQAQAQAQAIGNASICAPAGQVLRAVR